MTEDAAPYTPEPIVISAETHARIGIALDLTERLAVVLDELEKRGVVIGQADSAVERARKQLKLGNALAAATLRIRQLEEIMRGFEGIGFKPCSDPACYRPTLEMMKAAHKALHDGEGNGR